MKEVGMLVFLVINAWRDWRKREIFLPSIVLMLVWGLWEMHGQELWRQQILAGMGTGMILGAVSLVTKGAVGMGDVLLITVLGLFMKPEVFLSMLSLGMFFAAMYSLLLLTIKRKAGNTEIPFVPFLLAAYVGGMCL